MIKIENVSRETFSIILLRICKILYYNNNIKIKGEYHEQSNSDCKSKGWSR